MILFFMLNDEKVLEIGVRLPIVDDVVDDNWRQSRALVMKCWLCCLILTVNSREWKKS